MERMRKLVDPFLVSNCGWSILWVFNVCVAVQLSQLHESITTILQSKPSPEAGKVGKEALDPLMPIAAMQHFRTQISAPKKNETLCTWTASDCVSCFFESFAVCILWVYGSTSQGHPEPGRGQPSCSKAGALHNSDAIALIHMHEVHGITTDDSDDGFITSTIRLSKSLSSVNRLALWVCADCTCQVQCLENGTDLFKMFEVGTPPWRSGMTLIYCDCWSPFVFNDHRCLDWNAMVPGGWHEQVRCVTNAKGLPQDGTSLGVDVNVHLNASSDHMQ